MSKLLRISMTLLLAGSLVGCGAKDKEDVVDNNNAAEPNITTDTTKTTDTTDTTIQQLTKQPIQM